MQHHDNCPHVTPLSGNKGKIPFLGRSRRLRDQVASRHVTDVYSRLKTRILELKNCDPILRLEEQKGVIYYQKQKGKITTPSFLYIPAAGPWDRTSGPRPGRTGCRGSSPVSLTTYPLPITYVTGHQQHGKIIIILQIF